MFFVSAMPLTHPSYACRKDIIKGSSWFCICISNYNYSSSVKCGIKFQLWLKCFHSNEYKNKYKSHFFCQVLFILFDRMFPNLSTSSGNFILLTVYSEICKKYLPTKKYPDVDLNISHLDDMTN